jgi:cytochrome c-type biogenesis protein CcmH/NrfG
VTGVVLLVSLGLAVIAAFGILRPFRSGARDDLGPSSDPLEDERQSLLRSLRDLEDDRRAGTVSEQDYRTLRAETERRALVVLRALDARDEEAGSAADGVTELRAAAGARRSQPVTEPDGSGQDRTNQAATDGHGSTGSTATGRRGRLAPAAIGAALALAVVPLLVNAVSARAPGGSLSGDTGIAGSDPSATPSVDPALAPLVRRVQQHPGDTAARLELAAEYAREHRTGLAALQYTEVLRHDADNVEANTALAAILAAAGRPEDALYLVDRALATSPHDPEALFQRGAILMTGLHRPQDAVVALRAYLVAAPFGSHREEAERLIARSAATPQAGPSGGSSGSAAPTASP